MQQEDELLSRLQGVKQVGPNKWMSLCPVHDDHDPSLSIGVGDDGKLLLHCFGCKASFTDIMAAVGLLPSGNGHVVNVHVNGNGHKPAPMKAAGELGPAVATYDYRDADGRIVFRKTRHNTSKGKTFLLWHPTAAGGWDKGMGDVRPVPPYRLPELLADDVSPVFFCEGEKDTDLLAGLGYQATTIFDGASGKWRKEYASLLAGRDVYVLEDNDEAGRKYAAMVAEQLRDVALEVKVIRLPELPPKGDVSDWMGMGHTKDELEDFCLRAPVYASSDANQQEPRKNGSWGDLDALLNSIEWLWEPWIVAGFVHLVVAESGVGKSSLLQRIAYSFVDPRLPFPDGKPYAGAPGMVLWAETESAQQLNRDRAKAWGMNPYAFLTPLEDPTIDFRLDVPEHQQALHESAFRDDVRVIVVDSLSASHRRRENQAEEQMDLMGWLAGLARDCGKPILVTHHLRKRSQGEGDELTLDRIRGSSAIVQLARVVWALDRPDPSAPERLRLKQLKNNLQRMPEPIGVTISKSGVAFGAAPLAPKAYTELDRAVDFLRDELERGPRSAANLQDLAKGHDISNATLQRARKALSVRSVKQLGGIWQWELPTVTQR